MATARKRQVCLETTTYYHCVSRCVRRAFLCGFDKLTNRSYEHRRRWVESLILSLSKSFCIDIAAYAVMSNHYHVVLHVDKHMALSLSFEEIILRWHSAFKGTPITKKYLNGDELTPGEEKELLESVEAWRNRLIDISWFMRCINERVARRANKEDDCTGRFWEGRFKSQALLDDKSLLACMAYVDLNPIRAKIAKNLQSSKHTSVSKRLFDVKSQKPKKKQELMDFSRSVSSEKINKIPFRLKDYLSLLEYTASHIRNGKNIHDVSNTQKILGKLGLHEHQWIVLTQHFESSFKSLVGAALHLKRTCHRFGLSRVPCISNSYNLLGTR